MRVYETSQLRNVAVAGHGAAGKTTLVAAALFTAGATPRQGRVADGSAVTDSDEQEIQRRHSISTGLAFCEWNDPARQSFKINWADAPGQNSFVHEAAFAMEAVEAVILCVDAASGVQVQTLKVWEFAAACQLPVICVLTRADHDHANLDQAIEGLRERWGRGICPVHRALGEQGGFQGVIDLVALTARHYQAGGNGKARATSIPDAYDDAAKAGHEALVELVAEGDDALMQEFFDTGTIPAHHLADGMRDAIRHRRLFPVLLTAAEPNIGLDALLDFIADYAPPPPAADADPLSLFVFKTIVDPFAGRLTVFKVRGGRLKTDDTVTNLARQTPERMAHLSLLQGKQLVPAAELHAGDIGVVAKLKDTFTGDTLGDKAHPVQHPRPAIPEAAIHFAIQAKSRGDEDKVGLALHKMLEEDLALHFTRDELTQEFLLGGTGQLHVELAIAKLKKRYNVEVQLQAPKVAYRETILAKADAQGRYKKQTGGHGQFGDCKIRLEPLPRGAGFEFVNQIFGGAIPRNFIPAVEKGIQEAARRGFLAGFPVVDFRVVLYDGSYHDVDSSEMAFKVAGSLAFKKAMEQARPALLEPVMEVQIDSPPDYAGDLIGDLNARRGRIEGMQPIRAQVPLSEMLTYQSDLTAMTQGQGSYHMHFARYDFVPQPQAEKLIAKFKPHPQEE